jgi:hypothetical protein
MQWRIVLATIVALCAAAPTWAVDFPYEAYVNSADVYVRSGPGRNYYPTDKLPKGAKVEVYRHDPGGWYAIRPPRQSFSWVASRHLDQNADGLATVNSPRVVARVGSAFSDARDVIQVRLDEGEKVEVLDSHGSAKDSPWCKIAPPSGEFRWVFAKFVERELPHDLAADEREAAGLEPMPRDLAPRVRDVRLTSGSDEADAPRDPTASQRPAADEGPPRQTTPVIQRELDYIEFKLSAMVVEDAAQWSFTDLRRRAEAVLRDAQNSADRGQARVLLDKLARFDDIKQRHEALKQSREETAGRTGPPGGYAPPKQDDPRYDGVGRLSPVVSQKTGAPQFALVDSTNNVISFVTPAPGVNLRPFVDKYIGVNGQRGYLTELQRQHISVQRVTVLDVQRR